MGSLLRDLIERAKDAILGNPYWVVLEQEQGRFVVAAYRGEKRVPYSEIAQRHRILKYLYENLSRDGDVLTVPLRSLDDVKQILAELSQTSDYQTEIAPEAQKLHLAPPQGFRVVLGWSIEKACLEWHLPAGTSYCGKGWFRSEEKSPSDLIYASYYCGKGWFRSEEKYWALPGMTVDDERWLQSGTACGSDVIRILTRKVPEWKRKGLPFAAEVRYYSTPFFGAVVRQATPAEAILDITWKGNPNVASEIADLPGYVLVNGSIMPGATLRQLPPGFPTDSGLCRLSGEIIPILLSEHRETVKRFFTGRVYELINTCSIIKGQCELALALQRDTRGGVGHPRGLPVCVCEGKRYNAEQLSRAVGAKSRFVRVAQGWLPIKSLRAADIGPGGTTLSGSSLAPIALTPGELLAGGTARLGGSGGKLDSHAAAPPDGKDASDTAAAHLDFLRMWGIPGGIIGPYEKFAEIFKNFLNAIRTGAPDSTVLVVARGQTVDALALSLGMLVKARLDDAGTSGALDSSSPGLVLATPSALTGASDVHWSILCLVEADELVKSRTSQFLTALCACNRDVTIGLFRNQEFLNQEAHREAMTTAFRIDSAEANVVWRHGLRDLSEPQLAPDSPSIPVTRPPEARAVPLDIAPDNKSIYQAGYAAWAERKASEQVAADHKGPCGATPILPRVAYLPTSPWASLPDRASPIPPRTAQSDHRQGPISAAEPLLARAPYTTSAENFVEQALELASYSVASAEFVPFMCYWPTYNSMTEAQKEWYFYWRSRVREGDYPDTDLSYVFVHIYELINNIGVPCAADGYEQLHKLWLAYRARYPKLDKYIVDWMADYVIVNALPGNPLWVYAEAMEGKAYAADTDVLLSYYISQPLSSMPLEVLERLSDYRICKSKFYCDGNASLVDRYLPRALDAVDKRIRDKRGAGIFDLYKPRGATRRKRPAFQSAVYGGRAKTVSLPPVIPYSTDGPLREFITAFLKHSENKLRELKGFRARLRGYALEDDALATIDAFFDGRLREIAPPKVRTLVIDLEKVKHLQVESDEVRTLLGVAQNDAPAEQVEPVAKPEGTRVKPTTAKIERPEGTPAGLLTDLNPVNEVLSQLGDEEMRLVHFLQDKGWEAGDEAIATALPGCFMEAVVDRINNLSMEAVGDVLIVSESEAKVVAEDYRDEVDYLLKLGHDTAPPTGSSTSTDLPTDWSRFLSQLGPKQLEALAAMATETDPSPHVRRIAMEGATMPELLIDSINEIALNTIGDYVIAPGSTPPVVEEEDAEMVGRILQLSNART